MLLFIFLTWERKKEKIIVLIVAAAVIATAIVAEFNEWMFCRKIWIFQWQIPTIFSTAYIFLSVLQIQIFAIHFIQSNFIVPYEQQQPPPPKLKSLFQSVLLLLLVLLLVIFTHNRRNWKRTLFNFLTVKIMLYRQHWLVVFADK